MNHRWTYRLSGLLAAVALLAAGCAGGPALKAGPGGLPPEEAARISLVVSLTRAQFPELSGADIPYRPREAPPADKAKGPVLTLSGQGVGVQPGLQIGQRPHIGVALYIAKPGYAAGYLKVTRDGAGETWPIVAFDQRGRPDEAFDFVYVLADPKGRVHYLVLIGGPYEQDGTRYLGYEGTLIVPGAGNDLEHWQRAYKIDLGYKIPAVPTWQPKVEEAGRLFDSLTATVAGLDTLQSRIDEGEGRLAEMKARPAQGDQAKALQQRIGKQQADLDAWRKERDAKVPGIEKDFLRYWKLREEISGEYAAFVKSNRYRWLPLERQQAFFDTWKQVEFHHPRIDNLVSRFVLVDKDGAKVLAARTAAMEVIRQNNNWATFPGEKP